MDDLGADWEHEELMYAKGRAACARSEACSNRAIIALDCGLSTVITYSQKQERCLSGHWV